MKLSAVDFHAGVVLYLWPKFVRKLNPVHSNTGCFIPELPVSVAAHG